MNKVWQGWEFSKGWKKGVCAEVGAVEIVPLQNGFRCWLRRMGSLQNNIWMPQKPSANKWGLLENISTHFVALTNFTDSCTQNSRLLRLQNDLRCCQTDPIFWKMFINYPNIILENGQPSWPTSRPILERHNHDCSNLCMYIQNGFARLKKKNIHPLKLCVEVNRTIHNVSKCFDFIGLPLTSSTPPDILPPFVPVRTQVGGLWFVL